MTDPVLRWRCARVAGDALDVGCAEGETAILLGREGHRVIGIDPQRAPVDAAREHLAAEEQSIRERVGFQLADPADLPFDDRSFDTVLLGDLLAQQVSRERPIAQARRVLRPGGRLIVAVPYAGSPGDDETAISLQALLGELAEFSVKEIATVGESLCLLADRAREKSRATLWRRALGVAEQRIADRDEAFETLSASVADLEARREHEERALTDTRGDVERLEAALAAATHQRDRKEEEARLAADGVVALEQRVEQLRQSRDKERTEAERELERHAAEAERNLVEARNAAQAIEQELATARSNLEAHKGHLENAQLGIEARDAKLEAATESLDAQRTEAERNLTEARNVAQAIEQELARAQSRLEGREEHLKNAQIGIESRDAKLKAADDSLGAQRIELTALEIRLETSDRELDEVRRALEVEGGKLESAQEAARRAEQELAAAQARLEARAEELERTRAVEQEAQRELTALQGRLRERERELVTRKREADIAAERMANREQELAAAGTLLEAQGTELAEARRTLAAKDQDLQGSWQLAQEAEQELAAAQTRLEAREQHLKTAQLGVESRDRKLAAADHALGSRDAELKRLRAAARDSERKLALAEARLERAQQRAEHFQSSLVVLRAGRSYRLMRVLWRLRRPFRRAPRAAEEPESTAEDESEPSAATPIVVAPEPAAPPSSAPAVTTRQAPPRRPGERLRVASILDEMSEACFVPECDLVPLALDGWREQLDERAPDLLLVESAWNGNGGEWQYRIAQYPRKDLVGLPALRALLDGCRERGIPTAFWNKEDPVHFDRFAEAAALFDHVFTTDARCVERYRALPGGERTVTPLPFAAQPRIHNPAAVVPERSASPCFAGAWYRDRHPDRRQALEGLLDAARPYGLVIYDRSFGGDDDAFGFPQRFAPHILGKLPYERILDVYKSHRLFLNANSVVDSPTMCSRRVFELAACDTAILSTPGAALSALLGDGAVVEAGDEQTAASALERLLGDAPERRRRTRAARRKVFAEHTYAERMATIVETIGLDPSSLRQQPFAVPGASLNGVGSPPNGAGASANGAGDRHPWILQVQPGVALAEPALGDLTAAASFADADVIGAHPARNGDPAIEHRQVPDLDPRALLVSRNLIESRGLPTGSPEQVQTQLRRWSEEGVRLYATDADLLAAQESADIALR